MDPIKKRKIEDNGIVAADADSFSPVMLTVDDARKILEPFTHEVLLEIVQKALLRHHDVLDAVRSIADRDITQRKLFVRGLGWETTTERLRSLFSSYGELDEAVVILDKVTGKSKGYGFVTFKHIDGALMALKEPSKKIDGRMTVTQLAAAGNPATGGPGTVGGVGGVFNPAEISTRKIYVANVPYDMMAERLLQHFSMYGEIEEGPLGYDKATGKSKGFALFVYKTADAAKASLVDPIKNIDGHQLNCKLAIDGKRGKPSGVGVPGPMGVQGVNQGNGNGIGATIPGGQYGGAGGVGGQYGGFSSGLGVGAVGPGSSAIGPQAAGSNLAGSGGFGSGLGAPFAGGSHFGGPVGAGYVGLEGTAPGLGGTGAALGGPGSGYGAGTRLVGVGAGLGSASGGTGGAAGAFFGAGGAMSGAGRGSSFYGLPPSSAGMGSGDYLQGAHYSLSSSGYQSQHNQPAGASSGPRAPPGGVYQGMHPHY
ncbi:hypothetical protein F511_29809 [Dorcoceras hygrometricum]|uniref:RRM domain-containing protein n=1 Tax=Dorcoceras hygrometricum TaxID=472368 RepID=A0A2Z7CBS7_9LAMI|nr:hypothetical protein F511_29809 [Dorcoceras hygrometricum]